MNSRSDLSNDVAVFRLITSWNDKCYDHKCIKTFAEILIVNDVARNNNVNFHWKYVHFESDKILFQKRYDKTNLTLVTLVTSKAH